MITTIRDDQMMMMMTTMLYKKMSKRRRRLLSKIRSYHLLPRSFEFHPCCEKNARAASFPPLALKTSSSSLDHRSMFADFTCEMCTPKLLCMPEQSRHMNTQQFLLVHFGFGVLQSKHKRLPFLRQRALNSSSRSLLIVGISAIVYQQSLTLCFAPDVIFFFVFKAKRSLCTCCVQKKTVEFEASPFSSVVFKKGRADVSKQLVRNAFFIHACV